MLTGILLVALPGLLALAAGWDLASYTIPNRIQLAIIAAFTVFVLFADLTAGQLGSHLLAGFIGLVVGFTLFGLGYVRVAVWRLSDPRAADASAVASAADSAESSVDRASARFQKRNSIWCGACNRGARASSACGYFPPRFDKLTLPLLGC